MVWVEGCQGTICNSNKRFKEFKHTLTPNQKFSFRANLRREFQGEGHNPVEYHIHVKIKFRNITVKTSSMQTQRVFIWLATGEIT